MNRTVDRVPSRAETDWLRELREGQLATAASQAHAEPTLFTAAVAAALVRGNQPPRLEQISNQLHHRGRTGTTSEQTRRRDLPATGSAEPVAGQPGVVL